MSEILETKTVKELNKPQYDYLQYIAVDSDVESIREYLGGIGNDYDAFFVSVVNGDYSQIWGIEGIVPYLEKTAYRLK